MTLNFPFKSCFPHPASPPLHPCAQIEDAPRRSAPILGLRSSSSRLTPPDLNDAATSAETPDDVEPADDHAADPAASATTLLSNLIDEDLFLQSDEEDLEKQRKRPWRV